MIGGRGIELVESVLLEDSQLQHFFLEVIFLVLVVVANLRENVGLLLLAFCGGSAGSCRVMHSGE